MGMPFVSNLTNGEKRSRRDTNAEIQLQTYVEVAVFTEARMYQQWCPKGETCSDTDKESLNELITTMMFGVSNQ